MLCLLDDLRNIFKISLNEIEILFHNLVCDFIASWETWAQIKWVVSKALCIFYSVKGKLNSYITLSLDLTTVDSYRRKLRHCNNTQFLTFLVSVVISFFVWKFPSIFDFLSFRIFVYIFNWICFSNTNQLSFIHCCCNTIAF